MRRFDRETSRLRPPIGHAKPLRCTRIHNTRNDLVRYGGKTYTNQDKTYFLTKKNLFLVFHVRLLKRLSRTLLMKNVFIDLFVFL